MDQVKSFLTQQVINAGGVRLEVWHAIVIVALLVMLMRRGR